MIRNPSASRAGPHTGKFLALVVAFLVVGAVPVSASHLSSQSVHTTDSDFNAANILDNVSVVGSGTSASVDYTGSREIIDNFTDGDTTTLSSDWDGWNGDSFSVDSNSPLNGSAMSVSLNNAGKSIRTDNAGGESNDISFTYYFEGGNDMSTKLFVDDSNGNFLFNIYFNSDSTIEFAGNQVGTYEVGEAYHMRAKLHPSRDNVSIYLNGEDTGEYDVGTNVGDFGNLDFQPSTTSCSCSRTWYLDNVYSSVENTRGRYESDTHSVGADGPLTGFVNISRTESEEGNITWFAGGTGSWEPVETVGFSSTGNYTTELPDSESKFKVSVNHSFSYGVEGATDTYDTAIASEGVYTGTSRPSVDNASADPDGEEINDTEIPLSINISDPDFATSEGDTVSVYWYANGDKFATTTNTSNGTARTSYTKVTGGSVDWNVVLEDSYNNTVESETFTFTIPGTLNIRNETDGGSLVQDATVEVRFFETDNDTVITRETSDGTVNLTGLPVNSEFLVQASAPGYSERRVVLPNLFTQDSVYLLADNQDSSEVEFSLEDKTGNYPPSDTRLIIEKPVNRSGNTTYRRLYVDSFGANTVVATLENNQRHRLSVKNPDGDTRTLGAFTPTISETVVLTVGELVFNSTAESETYQYDTSRTDADTIKFNYSDSEERTDSLEVVIHERNSPGNETFNKTYSGPLGSVGVTESLNSSEANKSWVVDWKADRNSEVIGSKDFAEIRGTVENFVGDQRWRTVVSVAILLMLLGLLGVGMTPEAGATVTAFTGMILWWIGWLPTAVGGGAVAFALAISVMALISKRRGVAG